jgi:Fe-S-cluster containining protein
MTHDLPAGEAGAWLAHMRAALRHEADADVPCGDCCACCSTSHFVHVAPDETDTLAHVPSELLFAAPGMPGGHLLMGYDDRGRCPLLDEAGLCTIYDHRPRTCRTYDCRVFAAAGVDPGEDKPLIASRARTWRFDYPTAADRDQHEAVRAAARYLAEDPGARPDGAPEPSATQLAVRAIEIHERFLADRLNEQGRM